MENFRAGRHANSTWQKRGGTADFNAERDRNGVETTSQYQDCPIEYLAL